jgi:hypothetical protein
MQGRLNEILRTLTGHTFDIPEKDKDMVGT